MIYCIDIDGTICETDGNDYTLAKPYSKAVNEINRLYDDGHYIKLFTARGMSSKIDWTDLTSQQMENWGVNYHELIMNVKPSFDIIIDDKAVEASSWRAKINPKIGFIAGSFDIIHPGYILMFQDAKNACDHLIVALQTDPTIDRPEKNKPVQTFAERRMILESILYVDEILEYTTEKELYNLLRKTKIDVRILGSDYEGDQYNGHDLGIPVYFHKRDHQWSSTKLKKIIGDSLL